MLTLIASAFNFIGHVGRCSRKHIYHVVDIAFGDAPWGKLRIS